MKIKDVEKNVGISSHTIRFYEEMGMIDIKRDPDNKYREFKESDIKRLKEIKLFRGLGITMEEIRRFYSNEISLEMMMDHHVKELKLQHDDMKLKEELCEEIKQSKLPLLSYTVEQYEQVMEHKKESTPIQKAGSMISVWNKTEYSKKRMIFIECMLFPFIFLFIGSFVIFVFNIPHIIETKSLEIEFSLPAMFTSFVICVGICYSDYKYSYCIPNELYEFREKGIYYMKHSSKSHYREIKKALKTKSLEECMDYVSYDQIAVLKVWFHVVGRAPINGSNAYQVDFYIYTTTDELIEINTGMLGVSDEKVRLTAEILKEHAKKVIDPFRILSHLDLDPEKYYAYLDEVYRRKEHLRVFGPTKKADNI